MAYEITLFSDGTEAYLAIKVQVVAAGCSAGEMLCWDQSTSGRVKKVPTSGNEHDMPVGVAVDAIAGNAWGWMARSGIVYVLPDAAITAAVGNVITTSTTTAGRVAQAATIPVAAIHFDECGHWIENGSGNGVAARADIHFN